MLRPREELQTYVSKVFDVYGLPCQRSGRSCRPMCPRCLMCMGWQGKEGEELQTYVSKVFDVYGLAGQRGGGAADLCVQGV